MPGVVVFRGKDGTAARVDRRARQAEPVIVPSSAG